MKQVSRLVDLEVASQVTALRERGFAAVEARGGRSVVRRRLLDVEIVAPNFAEAPRRFPEVEGGRGVTVGGSVPYGKVPLGGEC